MGGKLLGLIREAVPSASRIAVLANPTNPGKVLELKTMRDQAPSLGVTIQSVEVPTPASLDAAFSTMGSARPDILVTLFDTELWGRDCRPPRHDHRFSSSRRTCSRSASMPDGLVQHDRRYPHSSS
jgi:hypothetical protein